MILSANPPTVFDSPVRIFPLGFNLKAAGGHRVILDDVPGRAARGLALSDETAKVLSVLSPAKTVSCETVIEAAIYTALADAGLVQISPALEPLSKVDLMAVIRNSSTLKQGDSGKLSICLDNGSEFEITAIGVLWLNNNNAMTGASIGRVTERTREEIWGDVSDFKFVSESASKLGLGVGAFFEQQVLNLLSDILASGLGSLERLPAS